MTAAAESHNAAMFLAPLGFAVSRGGWRQNRNRKRREGRRTPMLNAGVAGGSSAGPQNERMLNGGVKTVFRSTRLTAAIANTWGGVGGGGGGTPTGGGGVVDWQLDGGPPGIDGRSTERAVICSGVAFGTAAYSELPGAASTDGVASAGGWKVMYGVPVQLAVVK